MRRVTHERYISQSQWVNCDLARRYVGLNLSQQYIIMSRRTHYCAASQCTRLLRQKLSNNIMDIYMLMVRLSGIIFIN